MLLWTPINLLTWTRSDPLWWQGPHWGQYWPLHRHELLINNTRKQIKVDLDMTQREP